VARFSGRSVEPPAGSGIIRRVGGDAEQACVGFWPGNELLREPAFFAYTYPKPAGIEQATIAPQGAGWNPSIGEFILSYESVRRQTDPRQAILDFAESTFQAGATRQGWDPDLLTSY
jgi:hypothetical protein